MWSAVGTFALSPPLRTPADGRPDRHRQRYKARKATVSGSSESVQYRSAVSMNALEDVDPSGDAASGDDDDEYDELEDLMMDTKKRGTRKGKAVKADGLPKRFKQRSVCVGDIGGHQSRRQCST